MPIVTIEININNNLGFTTLLSIIIDGSDKAVILIINVSTVPIGTPAINNASVIGILEQDQNGVTVPKSAEIVEPYIPLNLVKIFFVLSVGK